MAQLLFQSRRAMVILSAFFAMTFAVSCASLVRAFDPRPEAYQQMKRYEISPGYNKASYPRVALLVMRVGNRTYLESPMPVSLKTNYALRTPTIVDAGGVFKLAAEDVTIEDESRLRESLPGYPRIELQPHANFFKNISPHIYSTVSEILTAKGYQVIDTRSVAKAWGTPLSEMTVESIIEHLRQDADALLVLHYFDMGDIHGSSSAKVSDEIRSMKYDETGFSRFSYTLSMFSVSTKERILFVRNCGIQTQWTIAGDPDVIADPSLSKRVKREQGRGDNARIEHDFSNEEVISFAMKYLRRGYKYEGAMASYDEGKGLNDLIP